MKTLRSEEAIAQSLQLIDKVFRGSLVIKASDVLKWKLYFRLGRLSWVTGGVNSNERLQRHLAFFCPQITPTQLKEIPFDHKPYREQKTLVDLQGKGLIARNQMTKLMESIATEVLFDAIQYGETNIDNLSFQQVAEEQNDNLLLLLPFLDINVIFSQAKQQWHQWQNAGFEKYSPNLYPIVKRPNILNKAISNQIEQQIVDSLTGTQTLRGIATNSKSSLLDLTCFLSSSINSGVIELAKIPLLNQETPQAISSTLSDNRKQSRNKPLVKKPPLIVCVDDSALICKAVKDIVAQQNYRFLEIQEPIKVIPTLLRNKPDLIFLDLMMPIINGYELCAQLRKTPSLKNVPIIILTGKDGLIDRMRAKLVGSTDFISKPVEQLSLLKMIEKHLVIKP